MSEFQCYDAFAINLHNQQVLLKAQYGNAVGSISVAVFVAGTELVCVDYIYFKH